MRSKMVFAGVVTIAISALIVAIAVTGVTAVTPNEDELLGKYEKSDLLFNIDVHNNTNTIVYWHQRKINDAIVEGDRVVYQFDKNTKELKKKIIHWRDGLPEHVTMKITKEQAESIAGGGSATLYFISPDSPIFKIKPTPKNPCWIVRSGDTITVIDSMNGKILGYGIPPP